MRVPRIGSVFKAGTARRALAFALALLHLLTFAGPLQALRTRSFRPLFTPSAAYAQGALDVEVGLSEGFNLFSFPIVVPESANMCSELVGQFGGEPAVESIARLNALTQSFEQCSVESSLPVGTDFPVFDGEGYVVRMLADAVVPLSGDPSCPAVDLEPGLNIVGVPSPPIGLSCFDLLTDLGEAAISTIERFNPVTGAFDACTFDVVTSAPAGEDFNVVPSEGYFFHMRQQVLGFNPNDQSQCAPSECGNDVADPPIEECDGTDDTACPGECLQDCTCPVLTCQGLDPARGAVGSTVTLRGTAFIPGSTAVTFDTTGATILNATSSRLDVVVPDIAGSAAVSVTTNGLLGPRMVGCGNFSVNGAPTLDPIGNRTVMLGQQIEFTVMASDPDAGDQLTLSLSPVPLPLGASFEPLTGIFRFQPVASQGGMSFDLTFKATDGQLDDTETVTITVQISLQTTLSGSVLTTSDLCPLEGVMLTAGADGGPQAMATTDANGAFMLMLDGVPTDGDGLTPLRMDGTSPSVVRHCDGVDTPLNQGAVPDLPQIREAVRMLPGAANVINCKPDGLCIAGERPFLLPVLAAGVIIIPAEDTMVMSPMVGVCEPDALGESERCDPTGDASVQCGEGRACNAVAEIQLEVGAGSAKDLSGCPNPDDPQSCDDFTGTISITPVNNDRSPIDLPDDMDFSVYFALQPFNVSFDPPQPICFPNVEGFPPGSELDIFAMDPDLGEFIQLGTATVCGTPLEPGIPASTSPLCSMDNTLMCSDGGVVRFGSWHGAVAAPPDEGPKEKILGAPGKGQPMCPNNSSVCLASGDLSVEHNLVSYQSIGLPQALRLIYHTKHAFPSAFLSNFWTPGTLAPPPVSLSTGVVFGGVEQGPDLFHSPDFCTRASCPLGRFARVVDASAFETGVYPAELTLNCNFPVSRRTDTNTSAVPVVNQIDSAFGAGWSLDGLERIHSTATGDLLLTNGSAEPRIYRPALRASAGIGRAGESDFYRFAGNRGEVVTIDMRRGSNQPDGSSTLDPQLELRDSRGFVVATDDDGGTARISGPGADALIEGVTLPSSDTYTVVAHGVGASTGPYSIFLTTSEDTPFVEGRLSAPDAIDPEFVFGGQIAGAGQEVTHTFSASVGTRVTIEVNRTANLPDGSGTLDPAAALRDSQGFTLASDDDTGGATPPGPGRNALIPSFDLPATDSYTLAVTGSGGTTGTYEVRILFGNPTGDIEVTDTGSVLVEPVVVSPPGDPSELVAESDGSFTRRLTNGSVKRFNSAGFLIDVTDRNGNTTLFEYDVQDRLVRITDPVGLETELVYNTDGGASGTCTQALDKITDPAGRVTRFEHDNDCNLIEITDPGGATRDFAYDDRHLVQSKTSARGTVTEDPDDFVTRYEYDFAGRVIGVVRPGGGMRSFASRETFGLTPVPAVCDPIDPAAGCPGNLAAVPVQSAIATTSTDAMGRPTFFGALDQFGNPTSVGASLGQPTEITRDQVGNVTRLGLPSAHTLDVTYDDRGNVTTVTDQILQGETAIEYEARFGGVTSVTSALGDELTLARDDHGNVIRLTTAGGRAFDMEYTPSGQIQSIAGPLGTTVVAYDNLGRVVEIRRGSGETERTAAFTYTPAGDIATVTDAIGRTTAFEYDQTGSIVGQTFPDLSFIGYTYDKEGNLESLTPPGRPTYRFDYDERQNPTALIPPSVGAFDPKITSTYNSEDQISGVLRPDGRAAIMAYDLSGYLETVQIERGTYASGYDPSSRLLTSITAPGGVKLDFKYNGSLLTGESWSGIVSGISGISGIVPGISGTVDWTLDPTGRMVSRQVNGETPVAFEYDADGFLVTAGPLTLTRDPSTSVVTSTAIDKVATTATYNEFLERVSEVVEFDGQVLLAANHKRDKLGRITQKIETIAGVTSIFDFDYDLMGRLTEVKTNGIVTASYSYAANGNRNSSTTPAGTITYSYDDQDRIVSRGTDETFTFTENGELSSKTNVSSGETTTYHHDELGNLIQADLPDGRRIDYVIDGRNRRIGKLVDGVLVQAFLYGDQLKPIAELDGAGEVVARFVYGSRANSPDLIIKGGSTYRVVADHVGSPRLIVDVATGNIAQRVDFDAFGVEIGNSNPGFQPFGFAGALFDSDTGLASFGARDYDPLLGRWLTRDPLGFLGGSSNLYVYVSSDPVNLRDVDGMNAVTESIDATTEFLRELAVSSLEGAAEGLRAVQAAERAAAVALLLAASEGTRAYQEFLQMEFAKAHMGAAAGLTSGVAFLGLQDLDRYAGCVNPVLSDIGWGVITLGTGGQWGKVLLRAAQRDRQTHRKLKIITVAGLELKGDIDLSKFVVLLPFVPSGRLLASERCKCLFRKLF